MRGRTFVIALAIMASTVIDQLALPCCADETPSTPPDTTPIFSEPWPSARATAFPSEPQLPSIAPAFVPSSADDLAAPGESVIRLPPVVDPSSAQSRPADTLSPLGRGGSFSGFGMGSSVGGPLGYRAIWFPSTSVSQQNTTWGMVGQDLSLLCPLRIDPPSAWLLTTSVHHRLIQTDAVLPDTGQAYPGELWNLGMGLLYHRQLGDGWSLTGAVNVGSASDHPFASIREMNVGGMGVLRVPQGERNAWMFSLMYSPTSEILFPIPGVAFNYNPSDNFQACIGLPFRVTYRPTERWRFEASYVPIHTVHAKGTYRFTEQLALFAGYDWANEAYSLRDRLELKDRFFLYDQQLSGGLDVAVARWLTAVLAGGFAYDRYSFEGRQWDTTQFNRVSVAPGPFGSLQLRLRY